MILHAILSMTPGFFVVLAGYLFRSLYWIFYEISGLDSTWSVSLWYGTSAIRTRVWIHKTIIKCKVHISFMTGFWKSLKKQMNNYPDNQTVKMSGSGRWFHSRWIHIFSLCIVCKFSYFQLGDALTNEIKHDQSPVLTVVFDPRYD